MNARIVLGKTAGSLVLALCMMLAGALAIWASTRLAVDVQRAHADARSALADAQRSLSAARSEEAEIAAKIDRFRALVERGAVGPEQRLAWVELIRDVRERHRLGALDYEFSPQRPLDAGIVPPDADRLEIAGSALRIRLPLLHEAQLVNVLEDLGRNASALVRVRECTIARRDAAADAAGALQAECLLDWITFRPRNGGSS